MKKTNRFREDATTLGETILLPIALFILLSFATMWAIESKVYAEEFDLKYNPRPEDKVLKFEPNVELTHEPEISKDWLPDGTHLPSLAKAIAWHETHDCTKGYGASHNNCFGIKDFYTGKMRYYRNKEHAYKHFYQIWKGGLYGQFPDEFLAKRWTGKDRYKSWLVTVNQVYNREFSLINN